MTGSTDSSTSAVLFGSVEAHSTLEHQLNALKGAKAGGERTVYLLKV
jgi:hypothetical protein